MKHLRTTPCGHQQQNSTYQITRGGVTLIEVLMSLLVMGVGVTAVATLFPMSVLRAVQGTQLTNAALLRYNAEAMMDVNRGLVLNPDGDVYHPISNPTAISEHYSKTYIVDPLGYYDVTGQQNNFGNGGTKSLTRFPGFNTTIFTRTDAANLVISPDSWVTKVKDIADASVTPSSTSVTLTDTDAETVASFKPTAARPPMRVVMSNLAGNKSITRIISDTSGKTISWVDEDTNGNRLIDAGEDTDGNGLLQVGLPTGFQVGEVRVEAKETRYTWLLTVKNNNRGVANVNVVVFFRRSFNPNEEHVFSRGNGADDVVPAASSSFPEYDITYDISDPDKIPFILRGGFVFDVEHARWYKIQKVVETGTSSNSKRITLDKQPPEGEVLQHVMFLRGVVDVYPISPKTP